MNRALASIAIVAAVICGSAAPALAVDIPLTAEITDISSGSYQVSSHSEAPTLSTRPTVKVETSKPSETKLAKTGSNAAFLVVLVPFIIAIGTLSAFVARKEDN